MKIEEALVRIGELLKVEMTNHLNSTTEGTGRLAASIDYKVNVNNNEYSLTRTMLQYGTNVDSGVRGWENTKGVSNPQSLHSIGQFRARTISPLSQLPYPVRFTIARDGIRPNPFIIPSIEKIMAKQGIELLTEAGIDRVLVITAEGLSDVKIKS